MTDKLKSAEMMPGNTGLPLIRNTISALTKQELFYWERHQEYGNIFKVSMPGLFDNIACLVGSEANRLVFKDETDKLKYNNLLSRIAAVFGNSQPKHYLSLRQTIPT